MPNQLFAKKPLSLVLEEMAGEHRLRHLLGPLHLSALGIGAIIGTGTFFATLDGFSPLSIPVDLVKIGTLLAFVIVCAAVWIMRRTNPQAERPFRVRWVPLIPFLGIATCLLLMFSLLPENWYRLAAWLAIGLLIYFNYGRKHSVMARYLTHEIQKHGVSSGGSRATDVEYVPSHHRLRRRHSSRQMGFGPGDPLTSQALPPPIPSGPTEGPDDGPNSRGCMKQHSPVFLGLTLFGLAVAVGALVGFFAFYLIGLAGLRYGLRYYPAPLQKLGVGALVRLWSVWAEVGAVVGVIGGILLGVWLARRLLTLRAAR